MRAFCVLCFQVFREPEYFHNETSGGILWSQHAPPWTAISPCTNVAQARGGTSVMGHGKDSARYTCRRRQADLPTNCRNSGSEESPCSNITTPATH